MTQDADALICGWSQDFEVLRDQFCALLEDHETYMEIKRIIAESPIASQPSAFHGWLDRIYAASIVIGARRIVCGPRKNDICFLRLLERIEGDNRVLSKRRYVLGQQRAWGNTSEVCRHAEAKFDNLCGEGARFLRKQDVRRDKESLERAAKGIADFASKHFAHISPEQDKFKATYGEIEAVFKILKRTIRKYELLLEVRVLDSLVAPYADDWKCVFRGSWLPKGG